MTSFENEGINESEGETSPLPSLFFAEKTEIFHLDFCGE